MLKFLESKDHFAYRARDVSRYSICDIIHFSANIQQSVNNLFAMYANKRV